ncbi:phage tail protein [Lysinibacillus sp. LZ02]|uniref:phage tail protein n=1 Tax=Lysinibacillus sp. LZ02 TaxID=3420668 RepID=UPI003D36F343
MDAYIGEIRLFAGSFAPENWAFCNGEILFIQEYSALYSIIGIRFGGDGVNTFKLPDLRGRAPMHFGNGNGLTPRAFGSQHGENTVSLNITQIPLHNHIAQGSSVSDGGVSSPENAVWGTEKGFGAIRPYKALDESNPVTMGDSAIGFSGGSEPHNNMQPFLAMNFIICLDGDYPIRP